jgi:hypothetical protein
MALTNAQKQARWRKRRNALSDLAPVPDDTNPEIAYKLATALGPERARKLAKALPRLLREAAERRETEVGFWNDWAARTAETKAVEAAYMASEITEEEWQEYQEYSDSEFYGGSDGQNTPPPWLIKLRNRLAAPTDGNQEGQNG